MPEDLHRRDWLKRATAGALGVSGVSGALGALGALGAAGLAGCRQESPRLDDLPGGFSGVSLERGHGLRPFWQRLAQGLELPAPAVVHRAPVVIAGGGMAGLAAARALELAGVQGAA